MNRPSNRQSGDTPSFYVRDFIQALVRQLDDVQDALALKVQTGRPVTWALKDVAFDLQVFVDYAPNGSVKLRNAGPNEQGSSMLHIQLSTITREMIDENTYSFHSEPDGRTLKGVAEHLGLDRKARHGLENLGVRTVGQLKQLCRSGADDVVARHVGIPRQELQRMVESSLHPTLDGHRVSRGAGHGHIVHLLGANLYDGVTPEVRLCGEPVEVVEARPQELVVRPLAHHREGQVEVYVTGQRCTGWFRLPTGANPAPPAASESPARDWQQDPWAPRGGVP